MEKFTQKRIWLTGASSGIGFALLHLLLEQDNFVYASARNLDELNSLRNRYPERLFPIHCDVTDSWSVMAACAEIEARTSYLDCVIVNAGTCEYVDSANLDSALFDRVFVTNFFGAVKTVEHALPLLRRGHERYIVGISSSAAYLPLPRAEAYGASKAALNYFLESLRVDLKSEGFAISIVSPGFVKTPLTERNDFPMPMQISAEKAAEFILHGMQKKHYEIHFPPAFTLPLKLISLLPTKLKTKLLQLTVRQPTEHTA